MKWFKIFAALIIAAVVIFQLVFPSATVRYRLALEADVDGKPANGSGVIEVSYGKNLKLLPNEREFQINVRGEAVALDLGQRGTLFALLFYWGILPPVVRGVARLLERTLGVEHLSGFDLGLGIRARPPAAAAVELAEHGERI